jgi:hypothetical protein
MMTYMEDRLSATIPHPRDLGAEVLQNMRDVRARRVTLEDQILRRARGVHRDDKDDSFVVRGTTLQRIRQYTRRNSEDIATAIARLQGAGRISLNAIRIPRNGKPSRRETVIVTAES